MDTGAGENFLSIENGENQGSPGLKKCKNVFESATQYRYNKGSLHTVVNIEQELELVVTEAPDLNLLVDQQFGSLRHQLTSSLNLSRLTQVL